MKPLITSSIRIMNHQQNS